MGDIIPNPELRKKRIQVRINELKLNLDRMDLRKAELQEELSKIVENETLTEKAIEDLLKELNNG